MAAKHTFIIVATVFVMTLFSSGMTSAQSPALAPKTAAGPAAGGTVALGPSSAQAPTPDCMTNLFNLSDCLSYVTAGSNLTKPDKPCCPELAGLVESSPQCLCYLLDKNATASYGLSIDMSRALNLPNVCHVSTPPVSLCSAIIGTAPVGAPTPSEGPNSPGGTVALGPSSAQAPTPDCMTNLLNLSDCLSYVTAGSNLTKPDKPCCPELAGLVESNPQCLCYLLDKNATAGYGLDIDMSRALNLPDVCHVSTPPVSLCAAIIGTAPVGGPTTSEGPNSPGLRGFPPEGLAPGPSNSVTSDASNIAISGLASLVALAIAFLPTLFGI